MLPPRPVRLGTISKDSIGVVDPERDGSGSSEDDNDFVASLRMGCVTYAC
jgi:hypothetical protein